MEGEELKGRKKIKKEGRKEGMSQGKWGEGKGP